MSIETNAIDLRSVRSSSSNGNRVLSVDNDDISRQETDLPRTKRNISTTNDEIQLFVRTDDSDHIHSAPCSTRTIKSLTDSRVSSHKKSEFISLSLSASPFETMLSKASIFFALLATCLAVPVYEQQTTFSPAMFVSSPNLFSADQFSFLDLVGI